MTNNQAGNEDPLDKLKTVSNWKKLVSSNGKRPWGRWNHQYRAYEFARKYLESEEVDRSKAALIRIPTGTGKTGIMALIANFSSIKKHVLIVVPSSLLTYQIAEALNRKFWCITGSRPERGPRPARVFFPATLRAVLWEYRKKPAVLICTNQSLTLLYKPVSPASARDNGSQKTDYERLKEAVDVVLIDEGHREPAKEWASAIRHLSRPAILFSATPYRNDLRMFGVGRGKEYRFVFKFQEASAARIVRKIRFVKKKGGYGNNPKAFADLLHKYYYGDFQKNKPKDVQPPKVIVRCESTNEIQKITERLRTLENLKHGRGQGKRRVIAIHEIYKKSAFHSKGFFEDAPTDQDVSSRAIFWVHQNKLVEGLDDPNFCLTAFYQPFGNARALVQQLGRIMRNPSGSRDAKAWVLADPEFGLEKQWRGYLNYEEHEKNIIGSEDIILAFLNAIPEWFYYSRNFRVSPDFEDVKLVLRDVRLKPSVRVYLAPEDIDKKLLDTLADRVSDELTERNMLEAFSHTWESRDKQTLNSLLIHWQIEQTAYLDQTGFFETRLLPTFLCYRRPYLFYHGCLSLNALDERYQPVEQCILEHLIPDNPKKNINIKQIAVTNTDLGNEAVRRRTMGGLSLERVGQMLNDHIHVINSVLATRERKPLYVGFARGTISEPAEDMLAIEDYQKWTNIISSALKNRRINPNRGLLRYARPIKPPLHAKARLLLLNLSDFLNEYEPSFPVQTTYVEPFSSTAAEAEPDGKFHVEIMGQEFTLTLLYTGKRFQLHLEEEEAFTAKNDENSLRASSFLSRGASIQVVTEEGLVYSDGQFFDPQNLWGKNRVNDLDVFAESDLLNYITRGEKGDRDRQYKDKFIVSKAKGGQWMRGSIFYGMDQERFYKAMGLNPDILICEDMGDERADFIAVDIKGKRIAQVHCKNNPYKPPSKKVGSKTRMCALSANRLHEVISQVQKNLGFFEPSERIDPKLAGRWEGKWNKQLKRVRRTPFRAHKDTVAEIQRLMRSNDVHKEVWIVMGNTYKPTTLPEAIKLNKKPDYYLIQQLYLLHACTGSVQMVGAHLKVITGTAREPKKQQRGKRKSQSPRGRANST